jgi:glycosyltransferase involved in cell wall biosynthesis
MPLITFVIPVYNVSSYISKCLDSILSQTEENYEVILIDDGSTDASHEICIQYAERDSRIQVYAQKNMGQGAARNEGVRLSKGQFIAFVDPDDWLHPDMVKLGLDSLKSENIDFTNFRIQYYYESGRPSYLMPIFKYLKLNGRSIFMHSLIDDQIYSSPCNKIYRADFLKKNNLMFPDIRVYEDILFSRLISNNANECTFTNAVLYYALIRSGSTSRTFSAESFSIADKVIDLEKHIFSKEIKDGTEKRIFSCHTHKFLSGLILRAAFNMNDKTLFLRHVKIIEKKMTFFPLGIARFQYLNLRSNVSILIAYHPPFAWYTCRFIKFFGFKIY